MNKSQIPIAVRLPDGQWGVIGINLQRFENLYIGAFWAWRTEKGSSRYGMGLDSAFLDICTEDFHCTI